MLETLRARKKDLQVELQTLQAQGVDEQTITEKLMEIQAVRKQIDILMITL